MSNNLNQGASIEAERANFEAWCIRKGYSTNKWHDCGYVDSNTQNGWEVWLAARRTPADAVGAGDLPPLPKHEGPIDTYHDNGTITSQDGYTAEQMQQFGREAIAHYLRKQAGEQSVLRKAVLDWWVGHCPASWSQQQHIANPTVNMEPWNEELAKLAAAIADKEGEQPTNNKGERSGEWVGTFRRRWRKHSRRQAARMENRCCRGNQRLLRPTTHAATK